MFSAARLVTLTTTFFVGGLMMGTQAEIVNVVAQPTVSSIFLNQKSTNAPTGGSRSQTRAIMIY